MTASPVLARPPLLSLGSTASPCITGTASPPLASTHQDSPRAHWRSPLPSLTTPLVSTRRESTAQSSPLLSALSRQLSWTADRYSRPVGPPHRPINVLRCATLPTHNAHILPPQGSLICGLCRRAAQLRAAGRQHTGCHLCTPQANSPTHGRVPSLCMTSQPSQALSSMSCLSLLASDCEGRVEICVRAGLRSSPCGGGGDRYRYRCRYRYRHRSRSRCRGAEVQRCRSRCPLMCVHFRVYSD